MCILLWPESYNKCPMPDGHHFVVHFFMVTARWPPSAQWVNNWKIGNSDHLKTIPTDGSPQILLMQSFPLCCSLLLHKNAFSDPVSSEQLHIPMRLWRYEPMHKLSDSLLVADDKGHLVFCYYFYDKGFGSGLIFIDSCTHFTGKERLQ